MKKYLILILVLAVNLSGYAQNQNATVYYNGTVQATDQYIEGNAFQKDYLLFVDMLTSTHPYYASHKADIEDGYEWAENCTSKQEFEAYLQRQLSFLNDSHTGVNFNYVQEELFPINLLVANDKVFLKGTKKENEKHLTKEVMTINGEPILSLLDRFNNLVSSDTEQGKYYKSCNLIQMLSAWELAGLKADSLQVTLCDNSSFIVHHTSKASAMTDFVWAQPQKVLTIREEINTPFSYKLVEDKCYLQFNMCMDRSSIEMAYSGKVNPQQLQKALNQYERFDDFLDGMFNEIKEKNIETLVVDVRDNGGGNSRLCDVLLSHLIDKDSVKSFGCTMRISKLWEKQYPSLKKEIKDSLGQKFTYGMLYDYGCSVGLSSDKYFRMNDGEIFDGEVIFILNEKTASSAGMLITSAKDNGIGKIIGTTNIAFNPSHYGDLLTWALPNTRVKGFISHKRFERPNPDPTIENSITPDVEIYDTFLDGTDHCWEWISENY